MRKKILWLIILGVCPCLAACSSTEISQFSKTEQETTVETTSEREMSQTETSAEGKNEITQETETSAENNNSRSGKVPELPGLEFEKEVDIEYSN